MKGPRYVLYFPAVIESLKELGGSGNPNEICDRVAQKLSISDEERGILNKNGGSRFDNYVNWARFYLVKAGFIDASRRGIWSLTKKAQETEKLSLDEAEKIFSEVQEELTKTKKFLQKHVIREEKQQLYSPNTFGEVKADTYREPLFSTLRDLPAAGFERLCQRLLRESGFREVMVTGRSGDGGIDGYGFLQLNPLVSLKVLFQCKRYSGVVSPSVVRDFRGAIMGRADKGIIMTTGTFSSDAEKEAVREGAQAIELIDGNKLIEMFAQLELGLTPRKTYDIDQSFFDSFRK